MISGRQGGEGLAESLLITHSATYEDRNPGWNVTKKKGNILLVSKQKDETGKCHK